MQHISTLSHDHVSSLKIHIYIYSYWKTYWKGMYCYNTRNTQIASNKNLSCESPKYELKNWSFVQKTYCKGCACPRLPSVGAAKPSTLQNHLAEPCLASFIQVVLLQSTGLRPDDIEGYQHWKHCRDSWPKVDFLWTFLFPLQMRPIEWWAALLMTGDLKQ